MVLSIVDSQHQLPRHSKSVWMYFANMKMRQTDCRWNALDLFKNGPVN